MPSEKTTPPDERTPRDESDAAMDLGREGPTTPTPDVPRTATDMTPGIPAGSGHGIDEALRQPDTELGGAVAGDTTPQGETADKPSAAVVRAEDKDRTTL